MIIDTFVPYIIEDKRYAVYIAFALEGHRCPLCGVVMIPKVGNGFPLYNLYTQTEQVKKARLKFEGLASPVYGDQVLCEDCSKTEVKFQCSHCEQTQGMDQVKQMIGADPADYLCLTCFKTVTAEKWEDLVDELRERHRYDYE